MIQRGLKFLCDYVVNVFFIDGYMKFITTRLLSSAFLRLWGGNIRWLVQTEISQQLKGWIVLRQCSLMISVITPLKKRFHVSFWMERLVNYFKMVIQ